MVGQANRNRGGLLGVAQANVRAEDLNSAEGTSVPLKTKRPEHGGMGSAVGCHTNVRCGKGRYDADGSVKVQLRLGPFSIGAFQRLQSPGYKQTHRQRC